MKETSGTKSSVDEIRARFDADVERFSNLETGQVAAMDSPMHMDLLTAAAAGVTPGARSVLDIGCGAGNYTLKLLQCFPRTDLSCSLLDLSRPMLDRAAQRVGEMTSGGVQTIQGDIREVDLGVAKFDIVIAAQCLHHLRETSEWEAAFEKIFRALRPGGGFWIADQIVHEHDATQSMMWQRWGDYLVEVKDEAYRDHVMTYVEKEDTPRSLAFQMNLMARVGFEKIDVLLKRSKFASFGGGKPVGS